MVAAVHRNNVCLKMCRGDRLGREFVFYFMQNTADELPLRLVGSEMCIGDRLAPSRYLAAIGSDPTVRGLFLIDI